VVNSPLYARSQAELERQNAALLKRVEKLERELSEIKGLIKKGVVVGKKKECCSGKKVLTSKYGAKFYGYVKFDAAHDDNIVKSGDVAYWAKSNTKKDSEMNITARQTRLGLKLNGPGFDGGEVSGRFEMDFYGSGGTENKPVPRLRLAYAKIYWPEKDFYILAGQDWDIIAPLSPKNLNFPVAWMAGNLGMRHPQLTLYKGIKFSNSRKLKLEAGISRTIGTKSEFESLVDTGEDSGKPTYQGRVGYQFPGFGGLKTEIGVSGTYGKEEYDTSATTTKEFTAKAVMVDANIPVNKKWRFKGEYYNGSNVDDYAGGIGQGVVLLDKTGATHMNSGIKANGYKDGREVDSHGGWAQLSFAPNKRWSYNLGMSMDKLELGPIPFPVGSRMKNEMRWFNVFYNLNKDTMVALEYLDIETEYKGQPKGDADRVQSSVIFKF